MLKIVVQHDAIRVGRHFAVTFQRTLRIPDDGGTYPLPPGLGALPLRRVEDFADRAPAEWRERGGVFIPMYQREALWLGFDGAWWRPNAVQIAVGRVNAVSGAAWEEKLSAEPQNYIVCPDQPWLDGINAGDGFIRQFVAMPLGMGYTVEAQVTGKEEFGGVQLRVYDPKPGRFPDRAPRRKAVEPSVLSMASPMAGAAMGLGAGGKIRQKIYPDSYGVDTWDPENTGEVFVHIVNSEQYRALTGREAPPTPISAATYTEHGLPWFDLYDEQYGDVATSATLSGVQSIREKETERGLTDADEEPVNIEPAQVKKLTRSRSGKRR